MNDIIRGLTIALTSSFISSVVAYTFGNYRATIKLIELFGARLTRLETVTSTLEITTNAIDQRLERMERVQDNERARKQ